MKKDLQQYMYNLRIPAIVEVVEMVRALDVLMFFCLLCSRRVTVFILWPSGCVEGFQAANHWSTAASGNIIVTVLCKKAGDRLSCLSHKLEQSESLPDCEQHLHMM